MNKEIKILSIILCVIVFSCACGKSEKLTANLGPASDGTDSNIGGSIYESDDAWSKTENRLEKGDSDIKKMIELEILGKKYELIYDKSVWNIGVGWTDTFKTEKKDVTVSLNSDTGELFSVMIDKYIFTNEDNYVPSKENGTTIKTEEEFEKLAKKYLQEIFGDVDYDKYIITRNFAVEERDYGAYKMRDAAEYNLDLFLNEIRTGEHIGVEMNEYGDFVACSRKNIGAYDDLDVDYLIDTGLLTDKACEVAGETIKKKYKEYGKEVKQVTYDTEQDIFCLDEEGQPIRIVYCHITLENGDKDSRRVVVGIEE